jgi:hypothetical protein
VKTTLRFTTVDVDSTTSGLRYKWPAFIEERGSCTSRFWSRLREYIKTRLKDTAILESRDEKRESSVSHTQKYLLGRNMR